MISLSRKVDDNMNKKGFTVVEVVISFSLLSFMLVSIISFTVLYRGKVTEEEVRTQLFDFKNTITKVIYDDIIRAKFKSITSCIGTDNCVNFTDANNHSYYSLKIEEKEDSNGKTGTYLVYVNNSKVTEYFLPDSYTTDTGKKCEITDFILSNNSNIYSLKIIFKHYILNEEYPILLVVS